MRVTIVAEDNMVVVGGVGRRVDLSWLEEDVHAVQWYDTAGEVEYKTINSKRKMNVGILSFGPYQRAVDQWNAAEPKLAAPAKQLPASTTGGVSVVAD